LVAPLGSRYRNKIGLWVADRGLQETLRQAKVAAGEIARQAGRGGVFTAGPHLEALTANGYRRSSR
jgi:hypothetical protein